MEDYDGLCDDWYRDHGYVNQKVFNSLESSGKGLIKELHFELVEFS